MFGGVLALAPVTVALGAASGSPSAHEPSAPEPPAPPTPIINGTFDEGDLAVVGLADQKNTDPFCTGTLVSRHVIVSAGHCLEFGGPTWVYFGSSPVQGGSWVPVRSYQAHPQFDGGSLANDISVVILDDDPPAAAIPVPLSGEPPVVMANMRFVGFGYTEVGPGGQYGRKYQTTATVTTMDETTFRYGIATCNGDSGGPAFVTHVDGKEYLAGVTSWGDGPCAAFGYDTRVDAYRSWIEPIVDATDPATCATDGRCAVGCTAPDQDCPCAADTFCTADCPTAGADPDCPAACGAEGTCRQDCPVRDPDCPVVGVGVACERDFDCAAGVCQGVCRPPCDPAAPVCADGLTCDEVRGVNACITTRSGGCNTNGRTNGGRGPARGLAWLLPAAVIALLLAQRRARR